MRRRQGAGRVPRDWRHTRLHESGWGAESWVTKRQEVERHEGDGGMGWDAEQPAWPTRSCRGTSHNMTHTADTMGQAM